ncbi:MAG: hypothetical protein ACRC14_04800 [Paracoccaceae bacterium]
MVSETENGLLPDIQRFCQATGMSLTDFGKKALNDTALITSIKKGRELLPRTERRVRAFMRDYTTTVSE